MKWKYPILGVIFAAVTVTGWLLTYWYVPVWFGKPESAGTFGDMFGALNALFSGFAFAGLLLAIIVQMDQLTHARQELALQRDIYKRQQVDATFFRLLDYYRANLDGIIITQKNEDGSSKKVSGIDALSFLLERFQQEWSKRPKEFYNSPELEALETAHYLESKIRSVLVKQARYLETLQSLLEFVDDEVEDECEKERYFAIVASQLTSFELRYIFYHAIVSTKEDGFRDIVLRSESIQKRMSVLSIPKLCLKVASDRFGVVLEPYKRPKDESLKTLRKLRRKARVAAKKGEKAKRAAAPKSTDTVPAGCPEPTGDVGVTEN